MLALRLATLALALAPLFASFGTAQPAQADAPASAPAATGAGPRRLIADLNPFPANEAPFDANARRDMALDALTFFVRQQGLFPGRSVYQLAAAPWFGSYEQPVTKRSFDLTGVAGVPLYLLANADPSGQLDPSLTSVVVDGTTLPDLASYVHTGVSALDNGRMRDFAVLDLVFAPPAPGHYKVEVRTRLPQPRTTDAGVVEETQLLYDISVPPSDMLGPLLFRDPAGAIYATIGAELRRVPNADTLRALGYAKQPVVDATPGFLAAMATGSDLPDLRDGMVLRADNSSLLFQIGSGQRTWIKDAGSLTPDQTASVRTVEAAVLQTIPPALADGMLLKGLAADVYHVDRGNLRKIPDWKWVSDHGLDLANLIYVPDRIVTTLPQDSPEWMMPGGTWTDRSFYSAALGRSMPYRIYLPPRYDAPEQAGQRYPVIYLLHGLSGRYDEWSGYGVEEDANQLLSDGKFIDAIIVAPQGGLGYWMNQDGGTRWGDYVAQDLVGYIDATYRTVARREARAIGGLSMGAHGAVQLSMNYPNVFGVVGAHSPSIRSRDVAPAYFGDENGFAHRDPISLVLGSQVATPPIMWIDTGDKDPWRPGAEALHQALQTRGWASEWHVFAGGHDGWYWGDEIWSYLPFYANAFASGGVPVSTVASRQQIR